MIVVAALWEKIAPPYPSGTDPSAVQPENSEPVTETLPISSALIAPPLDAEQPANVAPVISTVPRPSLYIAPPSDPAVHDENVEMPLTVRVLLPVL